MTKTTTKLSDRQRRFVEEYVKDFNATQAALRAGYAKKNAGVQGCQLLKNPNIQGAVREKAAIISDASLKEAVVDRIAVLRYWKGVVEMATQLVPIMGADGQVRTKEGLPAFKMVDANAANMALNYLAKHLRMYDVDPTAEKEDDGSGVLLAPQVATKDEWK